MKFRSDSRGERNHDVQTTRLLIVHESGFSHLTYADGAIRIFPKIASLKKQFPSEGVRKCSSLGRLPQNTEAQNVERSILVPGCGGHRHISTLYWSRREFWEMHKYIFY